MHNASNANDMNDIMVKVIARVAMARVGCSDVGSSSHVNAHITAWCDGGGGGGGGAVRLPSHPSATGRSACMNSDKSARHTKNKSYGSR